MTKQSSDLSRFQQACREQDLEALTGLIGEDFPLYIYIEEAYYLVFEHDGDRLADFVDSYVRTHPLNRILGGGFHRRYCPMGLQYRLYRAIREADPEADPSLRTLCSALSACREHPDVRVDPVLIRNLMDREPPGEVVSVLRSFLLTDELDRIATRDNDYYCLFWLCDTDLPRNPAERQERTRKMRASKTEEMIERYDTMDWVTLLWHHVRMPMGDVQRVWDVVAGLAPESRIHILKVLTADLVVGKVPYNDVERAEFIDGILRSGHPSLYWICVDDLAMWVPTASDYVTACHTCDQETCVEILSRLCIEPLPSLWDETDTTDEAERFRVGLRNHFRVEYVERALQNSVRRGAQGLVTLNETIARECFDLDETRITELEVDVAMESDMDLFLRNLRDRDSRIRATVHAVGDADPRVETRVYKHIHTVVRDIEKRFHEGVSHYRDDRESGARDLDKLLGYANGRGLALEIDPASHPDYYPVIYHFCESGFRDSLSQVRAVIKEYEAVDPRWPEPFGPEIVGRHPDPLYLRLVAHFATPATVPPTSHPVRPQAGPPAR